MIPMEDVSDTELENEQIEVIPIKKVIKNRRCSKVPIRELPPIMPRYQHAMYPQLYTIRPASQTSYKWDAIIVDLDRTVIHGKRLSQKRWRKYVENGTIPSLAENQTGKWNRQIHRKGHQMHPFIRGRTMIYYRPFVWHLLAVLDYLKSHFGTKIIICTKAGEHYAASVLTALLSNYTSANPDLIDDVYNFHDLHDDEDEEGKPKKPFRLICNRHELDPKNVLIVDDNALSWFGEDRKRTNFWMPPCYGYQIHAEDNELQLLCKYLWDPIQQHHLKNTMQQKKQHCLNKLQQQETPQGDVDENDHDHEDMQQQQEEEDRRQCKRYPDNNVANHAYYHSQDGDTTDSSISPKSPNVISSPKLRGNVHSHSQKYLNPNGHQIPNLAKSASEQSNSASSAHSIPSLQSSISGISNLSNYSGISNQDETVIIDEHGIYYKANVAKFDHDAFDSNSKDNVDNISPNSHSTRSYNKRSYKLRHHPNNNNHINEDHVVAVNQRSPKSPVSTRTKKKNYFFESKSRGSKKLAKLIGK